MLDYLIKPLVKGSLEGGAEKSLKASVDNHFANLKYSSSPIGRKGQSLNMRAFGLY